MLICVLGETSGVPGAGEIVSAGASGGRGAVNAAVAGVRASAGAGDWAANATAQQHATAATTPSGAGDLVPDPTSRP